jgi:hypothetical protein
MFACAYAKIVPFLCFPTLSRMCLHRSRQISAENLGNTRKCIDNWVFYRQTRCFGAIEDQNGFAPTVTLAAVLPVCLPSCFDTSTMSAASETFGEHIDTGLTKCGLDVLASVLGSPMRLQMAEGALCDGFLQPC